ncbi:LLM class flavin-dependent oxidoreductase [Streptomyces sp. NWU339]|uniref:LLM class flavin-dependent oxidoreductase n=1 Tax=Streptomyces sp. NWU339 TaxID=2185284 RepID=UPI000D67536A|nr:LLM class flavin-dependent oxidoreductase [Streptomyces sp. NWU339]PWI06646.1 LLM class flavin-dependent oxidoreductase [Streptomyces sp. NWU339]
MKIGLRYDMRAPDLGPSSASPGALYAAAVEQCRWADERGIETVYLAEHHGAEDNYCPSPVVLASAIAGCTKNIQLHFSALCITMHHPLRLAEDLAVLELIAGPGRILITAGIGYRPHEFEMFGVDYPKRAEVFEMHLEVLRQAWTGEEFEYEGRAVRVTPKPATPGGPTIYIGGNAKPSARRAARLGLGYRPATEELYRYFEGECERLGRPAPERFPQHGPAFVHITEDPERSWAQLAPHLMHASNLYAQWGRERGNVQVNGYWQSMESIDDLKADPNMWVITPEECLRRCRDLDPDYELRLHPLLGGLPPELSWQSLELLADRVLPQVEAEGLRRRLAVTA